MKNLDLECAKLGRELAESVRDEKVFTTALGVLEEEQGPYACFLYLEAGEGKAGQAITTRGTKFLKENVDDNTKATNPLEFVQGLASDLDRLLFTRDLLRQAFVYARYHAKARGSAGEKA
ncbi:MAG: hypothetical protein N3C12_05605 [Candidatus Binatia bacterium]|nr:hypothetical protein [Candidatus Binatia bacterium]